MIIRWFKVVVGDITDLLKRIETAHVPEYSLAQDVVSSKQREILQDKELGTIVIRAHSVVSHESGLSNYGIVSYHLSSHDGIYIVEQLMQERFRIRERGKHHTPWALAVVDADSCCIRESGSKTSALNEGKASIEYGHLKGWIGLNMETYRLAPYKLKFIPMGERIVLKSEEGPVEQERINKVITDMM